MANANIDMIRQLVASSGLDEPTIADQRAGLERTAGALPAPDGVTVVATTLGGRPAERITPVNGGPAAASVVLYLHGGGYCIGSLSTHRNLAGRLALARGGPVVTLDYRLAPEHPFPAAVDDAVAAYRELLDGDTPATSIAIAGDSAGGGLTVATLLALRAAGLPQPAAAACLSPWTDLTQSGATYLSRAEADPLITRAGLDAMAGAYLDGHPADDPLASPLFADLTGLPPLVVHVGDAEMLLDDAVRLSDHAVTAGVDLTLRVWDDMIHVFQAFPPELLPESDASIAAIAEFLDDHLR